MIRIFNDDYAEGRIVNIPIKVSSNKKSNVEYWDTLEDHMRDTFIAIAKSGGVEITELKESIDIKELTEDMISRIKKQFPEAEFPYVDEDY